jgi:hypothetical protein
MTIRIAYGAPQRNRGWGSLGADPDGLRSAMGDGVVRHQGISVRKHPNPYSVFLPQDFCNLSYQFITGLYRYHHASYLGSMGVQMAVLLQGVQTDPLPQERSNETAHDEESH